MEATIREGRLAGAGNLAEHDDLVSSARYADNNLLSELPGIAFGVITLVYIVASLVTLL